MKIKFNSILALIFLIFLTAMAVVTIPMMFGSMDEAAEAGNISTSEYAEEYQSGQTGIEFFLNVLNVALLIEVCLLFVMIIKQFI